MNTEGFKSRYYTPLAESARLKLAECVVPDLPERARFLQGHAHPLIESALLMHMHDERYKFLVGRTEYTEYVAIEDQAGDEVMRLSVHLFDEEIKRVRDSLHTSENGIWMPGVHAVTDHTPVEEQMDAIRLRDLEGHPFGDMRNALLALEQFGGDGTIDMRHLGTYLTHSLRRPSRITEYYDAGFYEKDSHLSLWELTYRPVNFYNDETLTILGEVLLGAVEDTPYRSVMIRSVRRAGPLPAATYLFPTESKSYGPERVVNEEDAAIVIQQGPVVLDSDTTISGGARFLEPKLSKLREDDDLIGTVIHALLERKKVCTIFDLRDELGEPYYVLRLATTIRGQSYEVKVKKSL